MASGRKPAEAYELTGYSEKGAAQSAARLLRDPPMRARVSELQAAAAERVIEKTALDRAWVLTRLRENVDRSMQAIAVVDSEGTPTGAYQYQPMAANKGLELIGKELGMFKERIEHSGPLGAPIEIASLDQRLLALSDEELGALKAVLLKVRAAEELVEAEPE